jgi:HEAT repeat protein
MVGLTMRHPATLRLNHKDERQRRRAVRKLFEVNDSINLVSFVPLLEDDDQWYRERAMEAITKWAGINDIVIVNNLSNSEYVEQRVLASKISLRLGQEKLEIIDKLCSDKDISVRIAGWESKFQLDSEKIDELILEGLKSKDKIIRKIAINKLTKMKNIDDQIIISALKDDSYVVRKAALEIIKNDSKLSEMEIFDNYLLKMSDSNTKKEISGIIKILVKKSLENQEVQEKVISWSESESVEIVDPLVSTLREIKWWEIKRIKEHMYEESSDLFVTRLLRGNRETVATEIRIKILSDSKRSEEMQARLIEDLVGRPIDEKTLKIIKENSISESVLLSTISKEFLQEYE